MRRVIGACAALLLGSATASAQTASYEALFDEVWSTVDQNFYDPYFHGVDWKAVREKHRAKLAGVRSANRSAASSSCRRRSPTCTSP